MHYVDPEGAKSDYIQFVSKSIHDMQGQMVTGNSKGWGGGWVGGCKKLGREVDGMINIRCRMSVGIF